jgi:superfamily II DNA/RNA helicase
VASDLFGRGIDIPRVNLVINFDFPSRSDVYLHRVGRTCRFGAKGVVINFIKQGPNEDGYYDEERLSLFQKSLGTKIDPLPEVLE